MTHPKSRRRFISESALATAGLSASASLFPLRNVLASVPVGEESAKYPIFYFTKYLDLYEPEFMAETLAIAGIKGFDLVVRPGGRVEPERVSEDLPKIVEIGKINNINTGMMVTAIQDARDPYAEEVLTVAAGLGIKHYRLGWYDYDPLLEIPESLANSRKKVERLTKLNQKLGIQGGYQNHSGDGVGGPVWDVWELIKDLPVEWMSSQFDVRHASVEGASSWIVTMRLLSKNIGALALKDYIWTVSNGKASIVNVPLGEGIVNFDLYFKTLKEMKIIAPITLHMEYPLLGKKEEKLPLLEKQKIFVSKIKKELDFIQTNLKKYQLI